MDVFLTKFFLVIAAVRFSGARSSWNGILSSGTVSMWTAGFFFAAQCASSQHFGFGALFGGRRLARIPSLLYTAFAISTAEPRGNLQCTRGIIKCACVVWFRVLHLLSVALQERRLCVCTYQLCMIECCPFGMWVSIQVLTKVLRHDSSFFAFLPFGCSSGFHVNAHRMSREAGISWSSLTLRIVSS